jgi:protease-4
MGKQKSSRGCLWAVVAMAALLVIVGAVILLLSLVIGKSGSFSVASSGVGVDAFPDMQEVWSCGGGEEKVVRIPLKGFIQLQEDQGMFGSAASSSQLALMSIRRATHDHEVMAIIMDIDSGGGGITASDIIFKALLDFKQEQPGRMVVAVYGDVAASGAYYISLAADYIIAHPTTITGSIGVLMQTLNMRVLGEKIGVSDVTIKSGANKDMLNPLREVDEKQLVMLQGIVDELHGRFVDLVAEHRDLPETQVRKIADGRILTALDAEDLGLIDEIGYWDDVLDRTSELLQVDDIHVVRYEQEFSLSSFLKSRSLLSPAAELKRLADRPRLLYRWQL